MLTAPAPSELNVHQPCPGVAVVEALGEHDLATRDETAELLARLVAENQLVVVDISETLFIDSCFLNNLAKAQRAAKERGNIVVLQVGTETIVQKVLEITKFLDHFDHVSSRDEALAWTPSAS
jgi:anti-anti-sigma factor